MTTAPNDPDRNVSPIDQPQVDDVHADKYNDPRAKLTRRGVLMGVGVAVFGLLGAAGSIYQRKTRLKQSRKFWGDQTILALQLAERIRMEAIQGIEFDPVELTATPGLGHLRHVLLDDRSYRWDSVDDRDAKSKCEGEQNACVKLILTDPTAHRFPTIELTVELDDGWVGPFDGSRSVQTTKRVRPALAKFLKTLINVQQKRSDFRQSTS